MFLAGHLGMLYAASGQDTLMRIGLKEAMDITSGMLLNIEPTEAQLSTLVNFNKSQHKPEPEGELQPGATYEGAMVYTARVQSEFPAFVQATR